MTLTAQNLVAWHDRDTANHVAERDKFAEKGFRPLSLSIYGTPNDPRFAAVMVKRPQVIATRSFINMSQSEYQKVFDDQAKEGFGPFIITATGPKNGAIFAGSFRKMSNIPLTRSQSFKRRVYRTECSATRCRKNTDLGRLFRHSQRTTLLRHLGPEPRQGRLEHRRCRRRRRQTTATF